jgi:dTMP kinase
MSDKSLFVTFEGIEGSGKSTQMALLAEHLIEEGYTVVMTREPGGTEIGAAIRHTLLNADFTEMDYHTEVLLYAADRAQHVTEVIRPSLDAGHIVISDRYIDSTIAYQHYGRDLPLDLIMSVNEWAVQALKPHITFLLDVPVKIGLERATTHAADRIEQESVEFHARVSNGFKALAVQEPQRWHVLDGTLTVDEIHEEIAGKVVKALNRLTIEPLKNKNAGH